MGSSSLGVKSASNEEHSKAVVVEPMEFFVGRGAGIGPGRPEQGGRQGTGPSLPSRFGGWEFLAGGGRGPGEPVHRDHLYPIAPRLGDAAPATPLNEALEQPSTMSSNLAGPVPARTASSTATRTGHEPAAG